MITINLWFLPRYNAYTSEAFDFGPVEVEEIPKKDDLLPLASGTKAIKQKFIVREVEEKKFGGNVYVYVYFYVK